MKRNNDSMVALIGTILTIVSEGIVCDVHRYKILGYIGIMMGTIIIQYAVRNNRR